MIKKMNLMRSKAFSGIRWALFFFLVYNFPFLQNDIEKFKFLSERHQKENNM